MKVGDRVMITAGFHEGYRGVIRIINTHFADLDVYQHQTPLTSRYRITAFPDSIRLLEPIELLGEL